MNHLPFSPEVCRLYALDAAREVDVISCPRVTLNNSRELLYWLSLLIGSEPEGVGAGPVPSSHAAISPACVLLPGALTEGPLSEKTGVKASSEQAGPGAQVPENLDGVEPPSNRLGKENEMETENKPAKPLASLAHARRCEMLVQTAVMTQAQFDAALAVTDVAALVGRKTPKKIDPTAPPAEPQEDDEVTRARLLARQQDLAQAGRVVI